MNDYNFNQLNDKEFEVLCADLLSKREGVRLERFKPGRDAGVDGRFFHSSGKECVLQCKHWATSPLEKLVKHLEDSEKQKIARLEPKRYFLAISHPLSRTDKARIVQVLAPYVLSPSDVLGREDLNDLLAEHTDVQLRHYKLWISSTAVLQHLLNKPIHDRSAFALEEILENARLYVATKNHDLAIDKLEEMGTVIITGPAGIGKTTLADHLVLHYAAQDYQLVRLGEEIREAEAVYNPEKMQLFYFDDFLGRNYLEALSGHEGAHIVQFIRRIRRDRSKRFILTSRTTILNQGKVLIDVLQTNNLERNEFEVTLESFSEMDRARILYSHIWHSDLAREFVDELYQFKRYRKIINHKNYNPRLIRYITDSQRLTELEPEQYWPHINKLLDNPSTIWEHPFEAQHDDFGRALVLLVTLNGRSISQPDLAEAFARYIVSSDAGAMQGKRDFILNLRHLCGSLLTRSMKVQALPQLTLFNPSLGDFVLHRYANDLPSLRTGFCSLRSPSSLRTLADLSSNNILNPADAHAIASYLLQQAVDVMYIGYSSAYISLACMTVLKFADSLEPTDPVVRNAVDFVAGSECPPLFQDVADLLLWARSHSLVSTEVTKRFIEKACKNNPTGDELERLGELAEGLEHDEHEEVMPMLQDAATRYLCDAADSEISDDDIFHNVHPDDMDRAEQNLAELIVEILNRFRIEPDDAIFEDVLDAYDLHERMERYFTPDYYQEDERPRIADVYIDEIDDLFERSF